MIFFNKIFKNEVVKKIIKNISWLVLGNLLTKPAWFFFIIYIARQLGPVDFGKFSFAISFVALFAIFIDFGLDQLSIREIAKQKQLAKTFFSNIFILKILLAGIVYVFIYITIELMKYPKDTVQIVHLAGLFVVLSSLIVFFRSYFRAFEILKYESFSIIMERYALIILGGMASLYGFGIKGLFFSFILANTVSFIINLLLVLKKITRFDLIFEWPFCKQILKKAIPFALMNIFILIYFRIDTVMLSIMTSDKHVGLYNSSYRLVEMLMLVPSLIMIPVYPVLSRTFISNQQLMKNIYEQATRILLIISICIALIITLFANKLLFLLYGEKYLGATLALKILVWSFPFISMTFVLGAVLAVTNLQNLSTLNTGLCALFNVLLNLILIPRLSFIGASLSTVLTEGILASLNTLFVIKYFHEFSLKNFLAGVFVPNSGK